MKTLLLLLLSFGATAQTTVNIKSLTFSNDAMASVNAWMISQLTGGVVFLTVSIGANATSITVDDGSIINNGDAIVIDNESFLVTAKNAKVYTVTPAQFATTSTPHASGAAVKQMKFKTVAIAGQQWVADAVQRIMDQFPYPTGVANDATIATANANKQAAKNGAVQ